MQQIILDILLARMLVHGIFLYEGVVEGYQFCLSVQIRAATLRMGINHRNRSLQMLLQLICITVVKISFAVVLTAEVINKTSLKYFSSTEYRWNCWIFNGFMDLYFHNSTLKNHSFCVCFWASWSKILLALQQSAVNVREELVNKKDLPSI